MILAKRRVVLQGERGRVVFFEFIIGEQAKERKHQQKKVYIHPCKRKLRIYHSSNQLQKFLE
jgi:hypothetical protein